MIVKPIDLAMVQRMNDVSVIKQQENAKPMVDQQIISTQVEKEVNAKTEQVTKKENADNSDRKFDAKDKSDNEYYGKQSRRNSNQNESDGKVFIKNTNNSFDVKI